MRILLAGTRSVTIVVAVGALLVFLSSPAAVSPAGGQGLPDTLRAGGPADWPPHYMLEDGVPTGFAVDVMDAVARRVGVPVEYVVFETFGDAVRALRAGEIDVIPDFGDTPSRRDGYAFTRPFDVFPISIFVRESSEARSVADLGSGPVAGVSGNAGLEIMSERFPDVSVRVFDDVDGALFELLGGGVEGLAYPAEIVLARARAAGLEGLVRPLGDPIGEVPRAMAVRPGNDSLLAVLDGAVASLVASPEYAELQRRWFGMTPPFWTPGRVAWIGGTLLLLIVIGMGVWRYHTVADLADELRRRVEERDRAQSALQEEETRFKTLVETAYEGIVTTDAEFIVTFVNDRTCEILGRSRQEILGRPVLSFVHPSERERVSRRLENRKEGVAESYEVRMSDANGRKVRVLVSASPIVSADGTFEGVVTTLADVTRRVEAQTRIRESERRFRAFVENSTDCVLTLDRKGNLIYYSPRVLEVLGYEPGELDGSSAFDLLHPEEVEIARERWTRFIGEPGSTLRLPPFKVLRKDGERRIWEAALRNLLEDPAVGAILANARDVTERFELERQLSQAQKMQAVGRLAGGLAHDFNNVLTVIRTNAELILNDQPSGEAREEAEDILRSAIRAQQMTSQLLAFSRDTEDGDETVRPARVFSDVERMVRRLLGEEVEFTLRVDEPGWYVRCGEAPLSQILLNMAVNAKDAMTNGGKIEAEVRDVRIEEPLKSRFGEVPPGEYVRIEVRDDGMGMSEETIDKIFEPFFTTKGTEGTGLGLSTVYGIVQRYDGFLQVESSVGEGARFTFHFPRAEAPARESAVAATWERATVDEDTSPGVARSVLVVEDQETVRTVARRILDGAGFRVLEAEDGPSALRIVEEEDGPIDLLLSDIVMPEMRGPELLERILELRPEIRHVFMSGFVGQDGVEVDDLPYFVAKPFSPAELLSEVRRALRESA